jgi:hypothetical protein
MWFVTMKTALDFANRWQVNDPYAFKKRELKLKKKKASNRISEATYKKELSKWRTGHISETQLPFEVFSSPSSVPSSLTSPSSLSSLSSPPYSATTLSGSDFGFTPNHHEHEHTSSSGGGGGHSASDDDIVNGDKLMIDSWTKLSQLGWTFRRFTSKVYHNTHTYQITQWNISC